MSLIILINYISLSRMSWITNMIEVYLVAIVLVIHISLLFCVADNCIVDGSHLLKFIPNNIVKFMMKMLSMIPISLPNLQLLAHFLLIGDVVFLITLVFGIVGSLLRKILGIVVLTILICLVIYVISMIQDQTLLISNIK